MCVKLRKATIHEIDTVLALLKDAAVWLQRGIDYWQNWYAPPPAHVRWIQRGFEGGEFYFAEKGTEIIGCFRLQCKNPMFWGPRQDSAGYVHSLTVVRQLAGQGIGRRILSLIESYCGAQGKQYLRLDCGMHVPGLRKYYEDAGFQPVRETTVAGERLILYQKPVSSM